MSTPIFTTTLPSSAPSSLCPGYKHVEEFGADDEYDDEDEIYVTLDLGAAEPMLIPSSTTYRLIGLDTPTPFLQLSGTILQGKHESLLGTELLFTEAKDTQDRSKRHLSFISTTSQRIRFREVLLKPKGSSSSSSQVVNSSAPILNPNDGDGQMNTDGEAEIVEKPKRRRSRKKPSIAGDTVDTSTTTTDKPTRRKSARKGKGESKAVDPEDQLGDETMTTAKGKGKAKADVVDLGSQPNFNPGEGRGRDERDPEILMQDDVNVGVGALP